MSAYGAGAVLRLLRDSQCLKYVMSSVRVAQFKVLDHLVSGRGDFLIHA